MVVIDGVVRWQVKEEGVAVQGAISRSNLRKQAPPTPSLRGMTCFRFRPVLSTTCRTLSYRVKAMDVNIEASTIKITTHNQYVSPKFTPTSVNPSPLEQFRQWFEEAVNPPEGVKPVKEPEAMSLATATAQGVPSVRIVLLKQVDDRGFVFYTNYESRKSKELDQNPVAALTFHWKEVSRQVRVVGRVERVTGEESDAYYKTRPIGSRLGAWASPQSSVIAEGELPRRLEEVKSRFAPDVTAGVDTEVPRPEFWGGWRIIPK